MRVVKSPLERWPEAELHLPDEWLGKHAAIRDEAASQGRASGLTTSLINLATAIALLENYKGIPEMDGKPEEWDFLAFPLPLMTWLSQTVLEDFYKAQKIPKNSSRPSPNGSKAPARKKKKSKTAGDGTKKK